MYKENRISIKMPTKDLQQFVYIKPNIIQRKVDIKNEDVNDPHNFESHDDLHMGVEKEKSIWSRKFKLRVTSINTGKEVDINFKFIKKLEKNGLNKKENLIC